MYIIAGLGNPTPRYAGTRHNAGFMCIERLSEKCSIPLDFEKHRAFCGKGNLDDVSMLIAEPQTYMNLSGQSIRELVSFYKIDIENELIVVLDDIYLPLGQLRVRKRGSAGGHNGLKNIIQEIGTDSFMRIRIGVGAKPEGWDLAAYVTSRFTEEEERIMKDAAERAADAVLCIIREGIDSAMNKFNRSTEA